MERREKLRRGRKRRGRERRKRGRRKRGRRKRRNIHEKRKSCWNCRNRVEWKRRPRSNQHFPTSYRQVEAEAKAKAEAINGNQELSFIKMRQFLVNDNWLNLC